MDRQTDKQTDTHDDYRNPLAHARRGLTTVTLAHARRGLIRNVGGGGLQASHIVTVDSTNDMTNCAERYSLNHPFCCVEQMLTEPFVVGYQNLHYRLRFGGVASLLLRHQTETVAGRQEGLNGEVIEGDVYKPLFYFTIDSDDGRSLNQLDILQLL